MLTDSPPRDVRPLVAVFLAALLVLAVFVLPSHSEGRAAVAALPDAETARPLGLASALEDAEGPQRVRILLRDQPLLKAAARPGVRQLIEPPDTDSVKEQARLSPARLRAAEKRLARMSERRYEQGVRRLADEAKETVSAVSTLEGAIDDLGGTALEVELAPAAFVARVEGSRLERIAERGDVQAVLPAPRPRRLLDNATPSTGAPDWWAAGFEGGEGSNDVVPVDVGTAGDTVGDPGHPAFSGVTIETLGCCVDNHGMHVGGVIASQDATYAGAAPGIDTLLGSGSEARMLGFDDDSGSGAADPAEVLNLSAGSPANDDDEHDPRDVLVSLFDIGYAAGAGNDNVDGTPTVANVGRNQLVMGAYNDLNNTTSTDDVILGISSRGPTPGGRKKPDLIAPGAAIIAPDLDWNNPPGNPDFTAMTGTSFSSPFGASALALLEGAGIGDSAAQRAILINSARDWDGAATGITNGWTPGSQGSWQPEVGWGALDLTAALADRANYELADAAAGSSRFFAADSTEGSKTTLAWELRGTWDGYPANGVSPIVFTTSNLDLRQYRADTLAEIAPAADPGHGGGPDAVDPNDTVEQVRAPAGNLGMIYRVSSESTIEGLLAEPFAIASTEPLTPLVNPEVEPFGAATDAAGVVSCASDVEVTSSFRNDSPDLDAESAESTLGLAAATELIAGPQTQSVSGGTLEKGSSDGVASWIVRATSSGNKQLAIEGSGGTMGETFTDTEQVSFTADCDPPETSIDSGPAGPTNDPTPSFAFSANEAANFECASDSGAFAACGSPFTTPQLPEGQHTFRVRSTDAVGNTSAPLARGFSIDTTPPETSIDSGPRGLTRVKVPTFSFSATGASASQCSIDGGPFGDCSSPVRLEDLTDGGHSFRVRSRDLAGNVEVPPEIRTFTLDRRVRGAKLRGKRRQAFAAASPKLRVKAKAKERAYVKFKGRVLLPGRDAKLKPKGRDLGAGKAKRVALRPRRARDTRRMLKSIRAGRGVRAKITARFKDVAGNKTRKKRTIKLR